MCFPRSVSLLGLFSPLIPFEVTVYLHEHTCGRLVADGSLADKRLARSYALNQGMRSRTPRYARTRPLHPRGKAVPRIYQVLVWNGENNETIKRRL